MSGGMQFTRRTVADRKHPAPIKPLNAPGIVADLAMKPLDPALIRLWLYFSSRWNPRAFPRLESPRFTALANHLQLLEPGRAGQCVRDV